MIGRQSCRPVFSILFDDHNPSELTSQHSRFGGQRRHNPSCPFLMGYLLRGKQYGVFTD